VTTDFPIGDSPSDCSPLALAQQDFLDLFDRILPESYLGPMKNGEGPGYEVFKALAKVFARASLAVGRAECTALLLAATGPRYSTGVVEFYRSVTTAGSLVIKAGTIVTTSKSGRDFAVVADVTMAGLTISANVQALVASYQWDVTGQVIISQGVLPGEIDTVKFPIQSSLAPARLGDPYADPTVMVRQFATFSGGLPAALDQLGSDRGIDRVPSETDSHYRARVRSLPQVITPDAIERVLVDLLSPLGIAFDLIETWAPAYQTCWFSDNFDPSAIPITSGFDSNNFCWSDPRAAYPFRGRWLSQIDMAGAFIVVLPNLPALLNQGMAWNDPANDLAAHTDTQGSRAYTVWNMPDSPVAAMVQGAWNGDDYQKSAFYLKVIDILNAIKAGGVTVEVVVQGQ